MWPRRSARLPAALLQACALSVGSATPEGQPPDGPAPLPIERSVVRVVTYMQRASWFSPWDVEPVTSGVGTGFLVEGGGVLTNAHVVADARMVLLFLYGDPEPHEARVVAAAHDADLALIEPVDRSLIDGVPRLSLGGLPGLR